MPKFPVNRVVVVLTPLIFAPLAGLISMEVSKLGVDLPKNSVVEALSSLGAFGIGMAIAFMKSHTWLKGFQAYEERNDV